MCVVPFADTRPYLVPPEKDLEGMASEGGSGSQGLALRVVAVAGHWGPRPRSAHREKGAGGVRLDSSLA